MCNIFWVLSKNERKIEGSHKNKGIEISLRRKKKEKRKMVSANWNWNPWGRCIHKKYRKRDTCTWIVVMTAYRKHCRPSATTRGGPRRWRSASLHEIARPLPTPTCCRIQTNLSSVHVLKILHVDQVMENSSNHKGTLKLFFAS